MIETNLLMDVVAYSAQVTCVVALGALLAAVVRVDAAGVRYVYWRALLALCLRFAVERRQVLDSLSTNAYSIYLVHYVFIVWLQYALLGFALVAVGKAAIVFGGTLLLSWAVAAGLGNVSPAMLWAPAKRWLGANSMAPAAAKPVQQDD